MATKVEVYEFTTEARLIEPKDCIFTYDLPDGAPAPAVGDVISLLAMNRGPAGYRVKGRSHLVSDPSPSKPDQYRLMSLWLFVSEMK